MPRSSVYALISAAGLMLGTNAVAQDQIAPDPSQETAPVQTLPEEGQSDPMQQAEGQAEQCRANLQAFVAQLNEEQFWVTGWSSMPGYGLTNTMAPPVGADPVDPATGEGVMTDPATGETMAVDPAAQDAAGFGVPGTWERYGYQSPRQQIQVLYSAAQVFAAQNNQEGCDYVLGQLASTYERFRNELADAGIEPSQITDWRQEQIALAERVEDIEGVQRLTVDTLIGNDVRSRADENLGSVNDVIVDPEARQINYLIVARGGFLGVGEELVAVPWQAFAATPDLNTLVLDIDPTYLESAPTIDSGFWTDADSYESLIQQANEYWQPQ